MTPNLSPLKNLNALDALNFLLADVRGALGPFLNVFLVTQQGWSQSAVGVVTMVGGLLGLLAQGPAGALIDAARAKRELVAAGLGMLAIGSLVIFAVPTFWPVMVANATLAVVGDIFGPAVAALTLGLYARAQLAGRMGRNGAFDHAGNVFIAIAAGIMGRLFGQRAVFLLGPVFALLAIWAVLSIPAAAINHDHARGHDQPAREPRETHLSAFIRCRPLMIFAGCGLLFHFANAPLLPLVGQKLANANPEWATAMMSSCIVAAQLVMLPMALFAGHYAQKWGRKPVLLIAFAILPVRACLYVVSDNPAWLIGIQLLDGVGAGLVGVLTPLIVSDLTGATGHYNLALGLIMSAQGVGGAISGLAAGAIVDRLGYPPAFMSLGLAAGVAAVALAMFFPETGTPAAPPERMKAGRKPVS
ncbi:putative MFS family arabinose efflux permease [Nitrospirillum amazonense]|uniref:Putative MFS family arabinose efflux permease n=1 Tax=Nitrospirillum amazonense TaxID=28077 RepID=A0A560FQ61_9PROT|nr:MFS transporter [Nitrospirillum amazonense]TWB23749.1 putative MFS family arabinose efflux permease [Nitrospirillum amazonense]